MITAEFFKNLKSGFFYKIKVKGHSGFSKKGKDIVCSAVSSIVLANVNACIEILNAKSNIKQDDGYLQFEVIDDDIEVLKGCSLLLESSYLALKELEREYPRYIKVEVNEDEVKI